MNDKGINLDFEEIAKKYNEYFTRILEMCSKCYKYSQCEYCIFHLDLMNPYIKCNGFMNCNDFSEYLAKSFSLLEKKFLLYKKIMKENVRI